MVECTDVLDVLFGQAVQLANVYDSVLVGNAALYCLSNLYWPLFVLIGGLQNRDSQNKDRGQGLLRLKLSLNLECIKKMIDHGADTDKRKDNNNLQQHDQH